MLYKLTFLVVAVFVAALAFAAPAAAVTPKLGDRCIGADIGRKAVDSRGHRIVCDNYRWRLDRGQTPRHPWADEQTKWSECIKHHSQAECRARLNH